MRTDFWPADRGRGDRCAGERAHSSIQLPSPALRSVSVLPAFRRPLQIEFGNVQIHDGLHEARPNAATIDRKTVTSPMCPTQLTPPACPASSRAQLSPGRTWLGRNWVAAKLGAR